MDGNMGGNLGGKMVEKRRRVILITDGDYVAQKVVESVAKQIGGRCISLSAGNPTPLSGSQLIELVKIAANDPVLVMCDDNGNFGQGRGEQAIEHLLNHPDIELIGVIAVASNTKWVHGTTVKYSIDNQGRIVEEAVDKGGYSDKSLENHIYGDTVDILQAANIPNIIGIGDIGKMEGKDSLRHGCPITLKAVKWIMERSVQNGNANSRETTDHLQH